VLPGKHVVGVGGAPIVIHVVRRAASASAACDKPCDLTDDCDIADMPTRSESQARFLEYIQNHLAEPYFDAMKTRILTFLLVASMLFMAACERQKTTRELLVEAQAAAMRGDHEAAESIFERLYASDGDDPFVLVGYIAYSIERENLERARALLDAFDGLDVEGAARQRANAERTKYWQAILREAGGDGAPANPTNPEAYEEAIIELVRIDRNTPHMGDWRTYLLAGARVALGGQANRPIQTMLPENHATRANAEQARTALTYLDRLLDGDPRMTVRPRLDADTRTEAQNVRTILRQKLFNHDFDAEFIRVHQPRLVSEERFDAEARMFLLTFTGPFLNGLTLESPADLAQQQAETFYAREFATDLAYELSGLVRGDAPPLSYNLTDFQGAVASELGITEDDQFTFQLRLPYDPVRKGAHQLHQRALVEQDAASEASAADAAEEADTQDTEPSAPEEAPPE